MRQATTAGGGALPEREAGPGARPGGNAAAAAGDRAASRGATAEPSGLLAGDEPGGVAKPAGGGNGGRPDEPAFEQALEELADIVRALETGEHGLDRSLELFQRGIALARLCHRRLDELERKIEWLLEDEEGRPYTEPAGPLLGEARDR